MIVLVTDFGLSGPYMGQMKAILARSAPGVPVIDLFADAPAFKPEPTAYLLAAFCDIFPTGTIFLTVVDPGVGGGRAGGILRAGGRWYVGPGNGIFEIVMRRVEARGDADLTWWPLTEAERGASATFHGRDVFAPAAARLATTGVPAGAPATADAIRRPEWPDDLAEVVYVDVYGNAMIGVRPTIIDRTAGVRIRDHVIPFRRTFSDVEVGAPLCYENANGLLEVALNQGNAAEFFDLRVGSAVTVGGV